MDSKMRKLGGYDKPVIMSHQQHGGLLNKSAGGWSSSITKTFEDFTGMFMGKSNHHGNVNSKYNPNGLKTTSDDSPPSSSDSGRAESDYGDYSEICKPPNKMRKIGGECEPNLYTRQQQQHGSSSNGSQNTIHTHHNHSHMPFLTPMPPLNHE